MVKDAMNGAKIGDSVLSIEFHRPSLLKPEKPFVANRGPG
jgi:hypothetical protein